MGGFCEERKGKRIPQTGCRPVEKLRTGKEGLYPNGTYLSFCLGTLPEVGGRQGRWPRQAGSMGQAGRVGGPGRQGRRFRQAGSVGQAWNAVLLARRDVACNVFFFPKRPVCRGCVQGYVVCVETLHATSLHAKQWDSLLSAFNFSNFSNSSNFYTPPYRSEKLTSMPFSCRAVRLRSYALTSTLPAMNSGML